MSRAQVDDLQIVAHLTRAHAAVSRVTEPELTLMIVAPTLDLVGIQKGARELLTRGDGLGGAPATEVDFGQVVTHFFRRIAFVGRRTEPELAGRVLSPTLHMSVVEQRTRVRAARGQRFRRPADS